MMKTLQIVLVILCCVKMAASLSEMEVDCAFFKLGVRREIMAEYLPASNTVEQVAFSLLQPSDTLHLSIYHPKYPIGAVRYLVLEAGVPEQNVDTPCYLSEHFDDYVLHHNSSFNLFPHGGVYTLAASVGMDRGDGHLTYRICPMGLYSSHYIPKEYPFAVTYYPNNTIFVGVTCDPGTYYSVFYAKVPLTETTMWESTPRRECERHLSQTILAGLRSNTKYVFYVATAESKEGQGELIEFGLSMDVPSLPEQIIPRDVWVHKTEPFKRIIPEENIQNSELNRVINAEHPLNLVKFYEEAIVCTPIEPSKMNIPEGLLVWVIHPASPLPFSGIFATDLLGVVSWSQIFEGYIVAYPQFSMDEFLIVSEEGEETLIRRMDIAFQTRSRINLQLINQQMRVHRRGPVSFIKPGGVIVNGMYIIVAVSERQFTDPTGAVSVVAEDIVIAMDSDFVFVWVWSAFDHFDVDDVSNSRKTNCYPWCSKYKKLTKEKKFIEWSNLNSITYDSRDGNLIFSLANKDWLVKVDYRDARGDGHVVWKFGRGGDFRIASSENQEVDEDLVFGGGYHRISIYGDELVLVDNGNVRNTPYQRERSRGKVFHLDLVEMEARVVMETVFQGYSPVSSSARRLSNGNYYFSLGTLENIHFVGVPFPFASSTALFEVTPTGELVHQGLGKGIATEEVRRIDNFQKLTSTADTLTVLPKNQ